MSGLQAALFNELGIMVWSSAQPLDMPPPPLLNVGQWNFQRLESSNAFRLSFGLRWIDSERREPRLYTVSVIDDTRSFDRQQAIFRSDERRVGKESVRTCRSRWWPYHEKKK